MLNADGYVNTFTTPCHYVRGQEHVKRAIEVAASGGHDVLMSGPAGAGKTLLARRVPSALPRMTGDEALEVTNIYGVSGMLPPEAYAPAETVPGVTVCPTHVRYLS